jgi:tetratricopeptide (TPR) repeat protein
MNRKQVISCLLFVAATLGAAPSVAAGPGATQESIDPAVAEVAAILNEWSGQQEVLAAARKKLEAILARDPRNYRAYKELARLTIMSGFIRSRYVKNGKIIYPVADVTPGTLQKAEASLRNALYFNPRYAEAYVLLGHVYLQWERIDDAVANLETAERIGTDDPWLQLNWAAVLEAKGDGKAAESRWRRVIDQGTSNKKARGVAYGFLIEHYEKTREFGKAQAVWKDLIGDQPNNAWARGNYAKFLQKTGQYDEAVQRAREALGLMDDGPGRILLASVLLSKWADVLAKQPPDRTRAEAYFREAVTVFPNLDRVMVYDGSEGGTEGMIRALVVNKKVSINARNENGSTALLIATTRNRAPVVKYLLSLGANPNLADRSGWTPLLSAADENNAEIVRMLLRRGARTDAKLRTGEDAAAIALSNGNAELAKLLRAPRGK